MTDNRRMKTTQPELMNVSFTHLSVDEVVETLSEQLKSKGSQKPVEVFTPNTEQLIQSEKQPGFLPILNAADIRIPDSIGLVWADWWRAFAAGRSWQIRERVSGVDVAERLLSEAVARGLKVALLGGMGNAGGKAALALKKRFRGLAIWAIPVGEVKVNENNFDVSMENENEVMRQINEIKPDLLLVGLGAPKQEAWVLKQGKKLQVKVVMVVGGAIDMWAGVQKRAPRWVRVVGLEWLWRLVMQPWRLGRQMRLVQFGWSVARGKV